MVSLLLDVVGNLKSCSYGILCNHGILCNWYLYPDEYLKRMQPQATNTRLRQSGRKRRPRGKGSWARPAAARNGVLQTRGPFPPRNCGRWTCTSRVLGRRKERRENETKGKGKRSDNWSEERMRRKEKENGVTIEAEREWDERESKADGQFMNSDVIVLLPISYLNLPIKIAVNESV